jgi:hypothetical protein
MIMPVKKQLKSTMFYPNDKFNRGVRTPNGCSGMIADMTVPACWDGDGGNQTGHCITPVLFAVASQSNVLLPFPCFLFARASFSYL